MSALKAVHDADGYPTSWPTDSARWLSPRKTTAAWVAEAAGKIVGHVCIVRDIGDPVVTSYGDVPPGRLAAVSRLFVAPAGRGRGLGAALIKAACSHASAQGLHLMLDVVDDGSAAVALYERLGWRLVERRPANWLTPEGRRLTVRVYLEPPPSRLH